MGEKRYPLRNKKTGERFAVPLSQYQQLVGITEVATGEPLYEPLSAVPGIATGYDSIEQTLIPKERVYEAASGRSNLSLLTSDSDPRIELSRQAMVEQEKRRVAQSRSSAAVALDSALSTVTFGQTSRLANFFAGEDAEAARIRQIDEHAIAHFGGRALGWLAMGLLPIPGIGATKVGKVAEGHVRGFKLFEAGTGASRWARSKIVGDTFAPELARRIAGPIAFAGVVEAPLTAATIAADIVDYDKELTGDMIMSEFATQYGLALGIAGVTSLGFAALGAGFRSAQAKLTDRAARKTLETEILDTVLQGGGRHIFRPHRSKSPLVDMAETGWRKFASKLVRKGTASKAVGTRIGRLVAGGRADDLAEFGTKVQTSINRLNSATTLSQFQKAVKDVRANLFDTRFDADLAFVEKHAAEIFATKQKVDDFLLQSRAFAQDYLDTPFVHPVRIATGANKDAADIINQGLKAAGLPTIDAGDFSERFAYALNQRRSLTIGSTAMDNLDSKLLEAVSPDRVQDMRKYLTWAAEAERSARNLIDLVDNTFASDARRLLFAEDLLSYKLPSGGTTGVRAELRSLDGKVRGLFDDKVHMLDADTFKQAGHYDDGLNSLIDSKFDDLKDGLEGVARANHLVEDLSYNARPFVRAESTLTHEQILAAQIETVMSSRQRTAETLWRIARKEGGARHTAAYGGVYLFRELPTLDEKRAAFRVIHDTVRKYTASPQALAAHAGEVVNNLAEFDMSLGIAAASTQMAAMSYMRAQMPYSQNNMIAPEELSSAEIENFLEAVGGIIEPISVLATAIDGSTMEQGVDAIRTVYPRLYQEMVLDIAEFVALHKDSLGHAQLLGLDTFTGYALGYSDGPAPDLTMQPLSAQTTQTARSIGNLGGPESRRMDYMINATPAQKVASM